jgi:hypothetical protein
MGPAKRIDVAMLNCSEYITGCTKMTNMNIFFLSRMMLEMSPVPVSVNSLLRNFLSYMI